MLSNKTEDSIQSKKTNVKNSHLEFKSLSDQKLLSQTKLLAQKERNITIQVIRHLSEIEYRKLHLKRGFSSLFDYTVKELGYSHSSAYRRIKAMKLCREMPETTVKIKTGDLNLTTVSQLQTFFEKQNKKVRKHQSDLNLKNTKQQDYQTSLLELQSSEFTSAPATKCVKSESEEKTNKVESESSDSSSALATKCVKPESKESIKIYKLNHNQKLDLLKKIEGKSSRQTEKLLCEINPELYQSKENIRYLKDQIEIKFTLNKNAYENIEKLKHLLSHKNPNMSYSELFTLLTELGLKKYDPRQKLKKKEKSNQTDQIKKNPSVQKVQVKNNKQSEMKNTATSKQFIFKDKSIQTKIKHPPNYENTDIPFNKQSRYIPAGIRRFIWTRDHGECSYICPETKRKCGSKHLLQIDHIHPYSLGGSSKLNNLRLLCAGHNQYRNKHL
ncbi:MAG: HNH endonuclease signature motif containing protein [Bdellovibrionales bacterium]|nr:HNH endonuclease signature motif containing protein [Bdellovibrionales bacterium]